MGCLRVFDCMVDTRFQFARITLNMFVSGSNLTSAITGIESSERNVENVLTSPREFFPSVLYSLASAIPFSYDEYFLDCV